MAEPFLLHINRTELLSVLDRINPAPKSDKEGHSKVIVFCPNSKNNKLMIFSKNMNFRYRGEIDIIRSDSAGDSFCFEFVPFYKLVSNVDLEDDTIKLKFDGSRISMGVKNGAIQFENFKRIINEVIDEEFWKSRGYKKEFGNPDDLMRIMNIATKTASLSMNDEYKRCCVFEKKAYFWYGNILIIDSSVNVPNFSFKISDVPTIKKSIGKSEKIYIETRLKDYIITLENGFDVSVPYITSQDIKSACFDAVKEKVVGVSVNFSEFKRVMGDICNVCCQLDTINLFRNSDSIIAEARNRTGRSVEYILIQNCLGIDFRVKFTVDFVKHVINLFESIKSKNSDEKVIISHDSRNVVYFEFCGVTIVLGVI